MEAVQMGGGSETSGLGEFYRVYILAKTCDNLRGQVGAQRQFEFADARGDCVAMESQLSSVAHIKM